MLYEQNNTNGTTPGVQYQNVVVGALLAITGNLLISISLNVQKYVHMQVGPEANKWLYIRMPVWWLGLGIMAIGEIGNFTAYGFAPASMVAPLGTTTVVVNMVIAVLCLGEVLRPEDLFGSALAVLGTFLVVIFSDHKEPILDAAQLLVQIEKPVFIAYMCIEIAILITLFILLIVFKKDAVIIILLIVAIIGSFTVISAKGVSGLIQLAFVGRPQWSEPILYIMMIVLICTAVLQIIYLNRAMRSHFSTVVVPTTFVFFTLSAIIGGIVMYEEFRNMQHLEIFMFLLGCLISFVGVFFIQMNRGLNTKQSGETQPLAEKSSTNPSTPPNHGALATFPAWLFSSVSAVDSRSHLSEYGQQTYAPIGSSTSDCSRR